MKKRIACFLSLILMLSLSFGSVVQASEIIESEYGEPNLSRWSYTNYASEGLTFLSDGSAYMSANVEGYEGTTTKIVIYFYLQKYIGSTWQNVTTYRDEVSNWYTIKSHTYSEISAGKYRLRCVYYVYGPDNYHYDYFMDYTNEKNYP